MSRDPADGPVLDPDEFDISDDERVAEIGDDRYVVSASGDPPDAGDRGERGERRPQQGREPDASPAREDAPARRDQIRSPDTDGGTAARDPPQAGGRRDGAPPARGEPAPTRATTPGGARGGQSDTPQGQQSGARGGRGSTPQGRQGGAHGGQGDTPQGQQGGARGGQGGGTPQTRRGGGRQGSADGRRQGREQPQGGGTPRGGRQQQQNTTPQGGGSGQPRGGRGADGHGQPQAAGDGLLDSPDSAGGTDGRAGSRDPPARERTGGSDDVVRGAPGGDDVDAAAVRRYLAESLVRNEFDYGFDATLSVNGQTTRHRMVSDDLPTTFETLVTWFAEAAGGDTSPERALGLLLAKSDTTVELPPDLIRKAAVDNGLSADDTIGDLLRAAKENGSITME